MNTETFNLDDLFEMAPREQGSSIEAELESVAAHRKRIAMWLLNASGLHSESWSSLVRTATNMGLLLTCYGTPAEGIPEAAHQIVVFAHYPEEAWRVAAIRAIQDVMMQFYWCDQIEVLQSHILGYSAREICEWMAQLKRTKISWSGMTMYMLIDKAYADALSYLGRCCFHPVVDPHDATVFVHRRSGVPRADAAKMIPANTVFGRVSLKGPVLRDVLGSDTNSAIASRPLTRDLAIKLNQGIESKIQLLAEQGWQ